MDQTNVSGFGDFTMGNAGLLSVRGGLFHDNYKDTGVPRTTSYTYQRSSIGVPGVPVALQQPINFFNTPRIQIADKDLTQRTFIQGDFTRSFNGGGFHNLKAGMGYQRTMNDVETAYPGGYVYLYWNNSFTSPVTGTAGRGTYGYYRVDDIGTFGKVSGDIISMYVQDSWQVNNRLTVNLGLRTERERVPTFSPDVQKYAYTFGFSDKLAPRLSVAYDVRGDGRVKVAGSWGRYFDWTKYELSRGSFIGDVSGQRWGDRWKIYYRALDTLDLDSLSLNNLPGQDLWGSSTGFRDLRLSSHRGHRPGREADVPGQLQCQRGVPGRSTDRVLARTTFTTTWAGRSKISAPSSRVTPSIESATRAREARRCTHRRSLISTAISRCRSQSGSTTRWSSR